MKKVTIVSSFVLALVMLSMWVPEAEAFEFYSVGISATGNCADCHSGYRDTSNYFSNKDGAYWGTSLHNGHLNNTNVDSSCDNCHGGAGTSGRQVNLRSSANAADGVNAISCSGCHEPLGLRAHHAANGITGCADCHSSDPTPPNEDVAPPWYGSVLNDITGTNLEPCNANGEEDFAGSTLGLDNDGDNLYDGDDPDCAVAVCGDGTVDAGETCDDGASNGTTTCGCQSDCTLPSAGTACADGEYCNGDETCDGAGACQVGTPVDCSDTVGCTDDSCDEVNDTCVNAANDANCPDDGQFCTGVEYCDSVTDCDSTGYPCQGGETCNEVTDTCDVPAVCGNGTVETGETCDDGAANGSTDCGCQSDCTYSSAGTACADGDYCNGDETCDGAGSCQAGTAVDCSDGVGCTEDFCDEVADACINIADNTNCPDDGSFCNGTEFCDAVNDCDSTGDPCQAGETCNEGNNTCDIVTCADIMDKGTCNNDPSCEWIGNPKRGSCQDIPAAEICDDIIDNDGDGLADCADPDCAGVGSCPALTCLEITDKITCNADPGCSWNNRAKICGDAGGSGGDCSSYVNRSDCTSNGCSWSGKDKVCS